MKKTIIVLAFGISLFFVPSQSIAQAINAKDGYGSSRIDCSSPGSQVCVGSIQISTAQGDRSIESNVQLHKLDEQKIAFRYLKSSMTASQEEENFKGKFAFIVAEDTFLDQSLQDKWASQHKRLYIKQGMYPIIEWEDAYFVSFQVEEK